MNELEKSRNILSNSRNIHGEINILKYRCQESLNQH